MRIVVPPTASSMPEWVRKVANAINGLISDTEQLKPFTREPFTVDQIVLTPRSLPTSPLPGTTVFDQVDSKVKTWDGAAWRSLY